MVAFAAVVVVVQGDVGVVHELGEVLQNAVYAFVAFQSEDRHIVFVLVDEVVAGGYEHRGCVFVLGQVGDGVLGVEVAVTVQVDGRAGAEGLVGVERPFVVCYIVVGSFKAVILKHLKVNHGTPCCVVVQRADVTGNHVELVRNAEVGDGTLVPPCTFEVHVGRVCHEVGEIAVLEENTGLIERGHCNVVGGVARRYRVLDGRNENAVVAFDCGDICIVGFADVGVPVEYRVVENFTGQTFDPDASFRPVGEGCLGLGCEGKGLAVEILFAEFGVEGFAFLFFSDDFVTGRGSFNIGCGGFTGGGSGVVGAFRARDHGGCQHQQSEHQTELLFHDEKNLL